MEIHGYREGREERWMEEIQRSAFKQGTKVAGIEEGRRTSFEEDKNGRRSGLEKGGHCDCQV